MTCIVNVVSLFYTCLSSDAVPWVLYSKMNTLRMKMELGREGIAVMVEYECEWV